MNDTSDANGMNDANDTNDMNDTSDANDMNDANDLNDTNDMNGTNDSNDANDSNDTNDKGLAWEEIKREHIITDEWIDFRKSAYRYPDGRVFEPFYSYSRRDYTVIVASDEDGNYLCVRQFRQGIRQVTTEFPAGGIEQTGGREYRQDGQGAGESAPGESVLEESGLADSALTDSALKKSSLADESLAESALGESALDCAKRELREETGYESDDWTHLITIPSNATVSDNYACVFMAKNCRKAGNQHLDETECLNVEKHSAQEIEEMIRAGQFQQSVHVMAWLLAKEKDKEKEKEKCV